MKKYDEHGNEQNFDNSPNWVSFLICSSVFIGGVLFVLAVTLAIIRAFEGKF